MSIKQTTLGDTFLTRSGSGRPILLLHGSGPGATGMSNWTLAMDELARDYDVLVPDLVGYGQSAHPDPSPQGMRRWMRVWVDQLIGLLDRLDIARTHLVGNSLGGAIALHLLMEAPERFDKVALMGAVGAPTRLTPELDRIWGFYDDPTPAAMKNSIRWFSYDEGFIADRLDEVARMRLEAALRPEVRRSFESLFPAPRQRHLDELVVPASALKRIRNPVLLIHGRDDAVVPLDTSLHLLQHLADVRLHAVGRCNHWTQIEHADTFHALLRSHFAGSKP
ncbi:MAG: alpha/beta fold hydrolase [Proteobacteria bacterium]|nr:alpha/beta fold hydrolase [Pseudomonadota bacterium]